MIYEIQDFLKEGENFPIIDVRTPAEFEQGHIPGAYNIPIFTNEERAIVGTIYKQQSKEAAVLEGLKIVGPKLADFVIRANKIAVDKTVLIHCWRGGMRSSSIAWLMNTAGLQAHILVDGYKAYRGFIRKSFLRQQLIFILGGMTGSNKTDILNVMAQKGEQFIDLENLALHRGSSYGQIGLEPQPTNEQFENNIAEQWLKLDQSKVLWLEDESKGMGSVRIVDELYNRIRVSPLFVLQKSKALRIKHLLDEYSNLDKLELEKALIRIERRIGGNNLQKALEALKNDDFETVVDISLTYYDKAYQYGIEQRPDVLKFFIPSEEPDPEINASWVIAAGQKSGLAIPAHQ